MSETTKTATTASTEKAISLSSPSQTFLLNKMRPLDNPLAALGFEFDVVSPTLVTGRLKITETCCQPFGVLHGGVSALIAEALGSIGATAAAGFRRVAGVQLAINHLKPAQLGEHVVAQARPVSVGRTIQVWDVRLWKTSPSSTEGKGTMIATARLTAVTIIKDDSHIRDEMTENHIAALKKLSKI